MAPAGVRNGNYGRDNLPQRYQESSSQKHPARRRTPPPPVRSGRRPSDYPPPTIPRSTLFSHDRPSNGGDSRRSAPYRRPEDRDRRSDRSGSTLLNVSYPPSSFYNERRSLWYGSGSSSSYLPPVRNPPRYVDSPNRRNSPPRRVRFAEGLPTRSAERDSGQKTKRRRSRSPVEQKPPKRLCEGGPSTPPEPEGPANGNEQQNEVGEDLLEILEEMNVLFRYCYQSDKNSQNARFAWLKCRVSEIRKDIEQLREEVEKEELLEVDSTQEVPEGADSTKDDENMAKIVESADELVLLDSIEDPQPSQSFKFNENVHLSMIEPETLDYEDESADIRLVDSL